MATRVSTKSLPGAAAGPDKLAAGGSASRVQSVDRAARLLRAVAAAGSQGAGTVALAEACALNRATAWRILSTLETHELVRNARDAGVWTIGAGAFSLVRSAGHEALLHESHEVVERLALQTGETAALAVRRNGGLAYVDEVAPPSVVAAPWGNQPVSLHATSTGKVLLAWTSEEDVARLLPRRLERFTDATITGSGGAARRARPRPSSGIRHLRRRVRPRRLRSLGAGARRSGPAAGHRERLGPATAGGPRPVPGPRRPHHGGGRPDGAALATNAGDRSRSRVPEEGRTRSRVPEEGRQGPSRRAGP